jgi:hypothetical protein
MYDICMILYIVVLFLCPPTKEHLRRMIYSYAARRAVWSVVGEAKDRNNPNAMRPQRLVEYSTVQYLVRQILYLYGTYCSVVHTSCRHLSNARALTRTTIYTTLEVRDVRGGACQPIHCNSVCTACVILYSSRTPFGA